VIFENIIPIITLKCGRYAQKVHAIMAELDKEDLEEATTAFIECLDSDSESAEEPEDFQ